MKAEIENIIIDWLKSGNENTTYLAHLIDVFVQSQLTESNKNYINKIDTIQWLLNQLMTLPQDGLKQLKKELSANLKN